MKCRDAASCKGWDWRALLIVLVFQLLVFAVIYPKGESYVEQPGSLIWQQPAALDAAFPNTITPQRWPLDFEAMEKVLYRIKFTKTDQVRLSPNTANILERLMSRYPESTQDSVIEERILFLVSQVFPGERGRQLSKLVMNYRAFYLAQQAWEKANPPISDLDASAKRFESLIQLKEKHLTKPVSDKLFAEQHRLARYIFERRRINGDSALSQSQKQALLKQLEQAFTAENKENTRNP